MTVVDIKEGYSSIVEYHNKYLKDKGVLLPSLERNGTFTKDALVLVYLSHNYPNTKVVTKKELTDFIRKYYPETNDVQQARHLGSQKGWYIISGTRKDNSSIKLKNGEYKLVSLTECYPGFTKARRVFGETDDYFEQLKEEYDYCCATCGSKEGSPVGVLPEISS